MEFRVMLIERGEVREVGHPLGYLPQASTVFEWDGKDLVVLGTEVEGDHGWIYVTDPRVRLK